MCFITTESRGGWSKIFCISSRESARFLFRDLLVHAAMVPYAIAICDYGHSHRWLQMLDLNKREISPLDTP